MSEMRKISYRDAVREAMVEEMRRDEKVFLMGEDIGVYDGAFGVSKGMIGEFGPERVRETPISEQAFVGAGVGAAITGMRPIVELMFSDFMTVCYDQIINQAAKIVSFMDSDDAVDILEDAGASVIGGVLNMARGERLAGSGYRKYGR